MSSSGLDKRKLLLQEIVQTEADYVTDLHFIQLKYIKTLRRQKDVVSGEELFQLFGNLDLITSVNDSLYKKLKACLVAAGPDAHGNDIEGFGEVFTEMAKMMLCYHQYCNTHKEALELAARLETKNPAFKNFIDSHLDPETGCPIQLKNYLIKPVQRVCRYPMLLKELIKLTPAGHKDMESLQLALEKVEAVTQHINTTKANYDNRQKMMEVERRLSEVPGPRLSEDRNRIFYKEGPLEKINPKGKVQTRQFFLFSDVLLWGRVQRMKKNHFTFKKFLPLDSALVTDVPDDGKNMFRFDVVRMDTKKIYHLMAKSAAHKKEWMTSIESVIDGYVALRKQEDILRKESIRVEMKNEEENFAAASSSSTRVDAASSVDAFKEMNGKLELKVNELTAQLRDAKQLNADLMLRLDQLEARLRAVENK
mmetsp:Transcript_46596/g.117330  ORF Transcript_46596/g.117330 Transcript_46596/m.117330 type:complete len:423 (+) Transcript_46596:118-1386(+)|eukprot:CAMPEP_0177659556 /NCGR_PEP_ID=MMETSP0447-20121125/17508_1 /TAXON_ID=0 /ORGANISM="Stygamoeba regulata, Strain BSH-02190019" /LENGTH=422 /DNA_ID=CAMNT_0019164439 /DNA_START=29 /DNA_END=1297 /DNA_ORIENTATION=+